MVELLKIKGALPGGGAAYCLGTDSCCEEITSLHEVIALIHKGIASIHEVIALIHKGTASIHAVITIFEKFIRDEL